IPSNEERRKLWLKAINRFDFITRKPWTQSKFDMLCSDKILKDTAPEHSYTCEPDTFKRKYQETLHKLEQSPKDLLNTKRREKRAKQDTIGKWVQKCIKTGELSGC
ncbi:hypothetical protein LSH36_3529g00000, partial [Paralvinella palmiformis]